MHTIPKLLIGAGIVLIVVGLLWSIGGKWFGFGRLPGDIVYEKNNVKFYFPIVTCIVVSVVLSLLMYAARWFMGK